MKSPHENAEIPHTVSRAEAKKIGCTLCLTEAFNIKGAFFRDEKRGQPTRNTDWLEQEKHRIESTPYQCGGNRYQRKAVIVREGKQLFLFVDKPPDYIEGNKWRKR